MPQHDPGFESAARRPCIVGSNQPEVGITTDDDATEMGTDHIHIPCSTVTNSKADRARVEIDHCPLARRCGVMVVGDYGKMAQPRAFHMIVGLNLARCRS